MNPIYLQFNCTEEDAIDLRQSKAVLEHKPDIILFEYPNNNNIPDFDFNLYEPKEKPEKLFNKILKTFSDGSDVLEISPWVRSDLKVWENINFLWENDHNVLVYRIDAPTELTSEWLDVWENMYPCAENNWIWVVARFYLREKIMTKNIQYILEQYMKKYSKNRNPKILVFLQSKHWEHVKFLLQNPTKSEIWKYYFSKFHKLNRKSVGTNLKKINNIFHKFWIKYSDFK